MPSGARRGSPKNPPPPAEFAKCDPKLSPYKKNWVRLAAIDRPDLYDWDDRKVSRFSDGSHPFSILYLADSKETAFWEVFGEGIEKMPANDRALYRTAQLDTRRWVKFTAQKGLHILDVTDPKTMQDLRSNASTWLAPYPYCQAWARALMDHPKKYDGFLYQSCRAGGANKCLALFSRPDRTTMQTLVGAHVDPSMPAPISKDPDILRILVDHGIDLL